MKISKNQKWKSALLALGSIVTIAPFSLIAASCSEEDLNNSSENGGGQTKLEKTEKEVAIDNLNEAINELSSKWLQLNFSNITKLNAKKAEVLKMIKEAKDLLDNDEATVEQLDENLKELNNFIEKLEDASYPEIENKISELDKLANELNGLLAGIKILNENNNATPSSNETNKEEKDKASANASGNTASSNEEVIVPVALFSEEQANFFQSIINAFNNKVTTLKNDDPARLADSQLVAVVSEGTELFKTLTIIKNDLMAINNLKNEVNNFSESQVTNYWDLVQYLKTLTFDWSQTNAEGLKSLKEKIKEAYETAIYTKSLNDKFLDIQNNRDYIEKYYLYLENLQEDTTSSSSGSSSSSTGGSSSSDGNQANSEATKEARKKEVEAWKQYLTKFDEAYAKYSSNISYIDGLQKDIAETADNLRFTNYLHETLPEIDKTWAEMEKSQWAKVSENKAELDKIKAELETKKTELKTKVDSKKDQDISNDREFKKEVIKFGRWVKTSLESLQYEIAIYDSINMPSTSEQPASDTPKPDSAAA